MFFLETEMCLSVGMVPMNDLYLDMLRSKVR